MTEIIKSELISRCKAPRSLRLTVAFVVATSVGVMMSASTAGAGEASGHVRRASCTLVRYYVAKYSAPAAEAWARSKGATDFRYSNRSALYRRNKSHGPATNCPELKQSQIKFRLLPPIPDVTVVMSSISSIRTAARRGSSRWNPASAASARRSGASPAFMLSPAICSSCASRVHQADSRTTVSTPATLRATVAIPATSMLESRFRFDAMRHFWRQSSDGIDLDHGPKMIHPPFPGPPRRGRRRPGAIFTHRLRDRRRMA